MLPDGTLVVPIRDDADGSDDEEELSGIIEVHLDNFIHSYFLLKYLL